MDEELRLKNVHIVLFFKNVIEYNSLKLANTIFEKMPDLGQPNIINLPNDVPNEIRMQAPRIMFNNSKDINLTISMTNIELNSVTIEDDGVIKNALRLINEALTQEGIQIQAMGNVFDFSKFDFDFSKLKEVFYKDELSTCDLINSSWYKKEDYNIWKTINIEDKNDKKILNVRIDINNKGNENLMSSDDIIAMLESSINKAETFKQELLRKLG